MFLLLANDICSGPLHRHVLQVQERTEPWNTSSADAELLSDLATMRSALDEVQGMVLVTDSWRTHGQVTVTSFFPIHGSCQPEVWYAQQSHLALAPL